MGQTKLLIPDSALPEGLDNQEVIIGLRPEHITHKPVKDESTVEVNLDVVELMGSEYMVYATIEGHSFVGRVDANLDLAAGTVFPMAFEMDKARFFDPTTEKRIK